MFLVVIEKELVNPYIKEVEHVKDFILSKRPYKILMPFDTEEEAREAIDYLIAME